MSKKMGKGYGETGQKKVIANNVLLKLCSISLVIKELQIKTK